MNQNPKSYEKCKAQRIIVKNKLVKVNERPWIEFGEKMEEERR